MSKKTNPDQSPRAPGDAPAAGDIGERGLVQPGFRAVQWRMLLATMFCYLFYYTGRQTFGFAIPGIQAEYGWTKEQLGWCSTALLWTYALGQVVNGTLGDRFGGRRLMSLGAILSCGLNWALSFGTSIFHIGLCWAANGYVQSMGWAPGGRVITNWWSRFERGRVFGLYVFAAGMSSVLSFVLALSVEELGWRWIFRLPVLLLLAAGVIYFLIVRDHPRDLGYKAPEEEDPEEAEAEEATREEAGQQELAASTVSGETDNGASLARKLQFAFACLSIGFQNAARYGLLIWVPVHFLGSDWKQGGGKWISVALPVGMALGALTSGWISDRFLNRRRWPVISGAMLLGAGVSGAMYWIPQDQVLLAVACLFLAGFLVYAPQSAFWALCPDLMGFRRAATATGVMNCVAYVFAGIGEPLIGGIIDRSLDDTGLVFLIVAIACLAGGLLAPFIRR